MARDRLLPPAFASVSERSRVPSGSILLTGAIVAIASLFSSLEEMVDLTNIGTLFAFIIVSIGVIVLRHRGVEGAFRVPFGYLIPSLAILGCLGLIAYLPPTSWLRFASWMNLGVVVYFLYGLPRSSSRESSEKGMFDAYVAWCGGRVSLAAAALLLIAAFADQARGGPVGGFWLYAPVCCNLALLLPTLLLKGVRATREGRNEGKESVITALCAIILNAVLLVRS